jgi:hypothetical protein
VSARSAVVAVAAAIVAGCLASCGGGGASGDRSDASPPSGHEEVAVIENWIDALSGGDVEGAAGYFALPSVVENGAAPVTLRSRGGGCGSGSGQLARTAFVIKEGKIVQWRRLANPPRGGGGGGPIV